jgi:hypothetical protein
MTREIETTPLLSPCIRNTWRYKPAIVLAAVVLPQLVGLILGLWWIGRDIGGRDIGLDKYYTKFRLRYGVEDYWHLII